ncbi:MAG: outer membrane protein transport protein [Gallionellaceae bacterium]|nr:outer membrane protein transport protein [Gallionellaceae bacterium]
MKRKALALAGLWCMVGGAQGAGFALIEQNASGLGNAYAGQAAVAEDASTVFFNPAGMSRLEGKQVVVAAHYIRPAAEFSGASTPSFVTATGGDAGKPALVPNAYYVMGLSERLRFGLGLNGPFGLATEYDTPWAGQTQAILSDVKTYNVNPSLSWQVNDRVAVGIGLDWQRIKAKLTSAAHPVVPAVVTMKGDDDSWGWNAGVLFTLDEDTRVGVNFRSEVEHALTGTLATPTPAVYPVQADLTLPATASVSLFRRLTPAWDLLADLTWTGWGSFDELRVRHAGSGATLSLVDESWDDTWRVSVGANYHAGDRLTWRFGVAYDQTPVPDAVHRTPRIPDEDRTWLAVGGQYRVSGQGRVDFGYAHLFVKDARIAHTENGIALGGVYDNQVDIVSVQYTHTF